MRQNAERTALSAAMSVKASFFETLSNSSAAERIARVVQPVHSDTDSGNIRSSTSTDVMSGSVSMKEPT